MKPHVQHHPLKNKFFKNIKKKKYINLKSLFLFVHITYTQYQQEFCYDSFLIQYHYHPKKKFMITNKNNKSVFNATFGRFQKTIPINKQSSKCIKHKMQQSFTKDNSKYKMRRDLEFPLIIIKENVHSKTQISFIPSQPKRCVINK
jgi:hypothetical protein